LFVFLQKTAGIFFSLLQLCATTPAYTISVITFVILGGALHNLLFSRKKNRALEAERAKRRSAELQLAQYKEITEKAFGHFPSKEELRNSAEKLFEKARQDALNSAEKYGNLLQRVTSYFDTIERALEYLVQEKGSSQAVLNQAQGLVESLQQFALHFGGTGFPLLRDTVHENTARSLEGSLHMQELTRQCTDVLAKFRALIEIYGSRLNGNGNGNGNGKSSGSVILTEQNSEKQVLQVKPISGETQMLSEDEIIAESLQHSKPATPPQEEPTESTDRIRERQETIENIIGGIDLLTGEVAQVSPE